MCNRWSALVAVGFALFCPFTTFAVPPQAGKTPAKTDIHGDPLPEGAIARLGTVRFRHGSYAIQSLGFSPDGKILASAGYDNAIRLWDTADGRPVAEAPGTFTDRIAFMKDGKTLVTRSRWSITLFEIATRKVRLSLKLPENCYGQTLTLDEQTIVTSSTASDVTIFSFFSDSKDKKEQWIELHHWDLASGKKTHVNRIPNLHGQHVLAPVAGKQEAVMLFTIHGKVIKSWASDTGKPGPEFQGHTETVSHMAVSPDGKVLATIAYDHTLRFWDTATGKLLHTLECRLLFYDLGFSSNGKTFGCQERDGSIHLWDVPAGKALRSIEMSRAGSFAFSPDGKTVAVSEGCTIHLYDLATGKECMTWPGHRREVTSIAFANDGQSLVSGGSEGAVYLWRNFDGSKPQLLAENMGYIFNVTFAPGRSLLAASGWDGVRLWDTKTGKLTATKQEDSFRTGRVQFFPDGKTLLVAGDWQLAWLWSIDTDKVRRYNEGRIFLTGGSLTIFNTAALSPDGKALLEFGLSMPGIVRDPETGEERSTVSNEAIQFGSGSVRFAPDSKTLVLSNSVWRERKVFFVDVATSAVLRSSNVLKDFSPTTFAFSPDGHTVAVGGYDGSIILLEYSTGGTRLRFRGHIGEINELAFSPDGKRLASASGDGTILLWQLDRLPGLAADQRPLNNKRLQALWNDLGSADANVAYRAIHRLRQDSKNSSTALIEQIHNLWKHDKKVVGQLIVDLASEKYAVRSKATTQLEAMQDAAALELHNALQGNPPLETALRLKALLKKLNGSTPLPRQLQVLRAMEVLEHAATADGKKWFQEMANNTSETYLTREARLAWKRLEGK